MDFLQSRYFGKCFLLLWSLIGLSHYPRVCANIHDAPIIISARSIASATGAAIGSYRVFRTNLKGEASVIPFQFDEVNRYGEYVLDQGPKPNSSSGNGVFSLDDELVIMGNDVGTLKEPKSFPGSPPHRLYRVDFAKRGEQPQGAVFIGIYQSKVAPPPLTAQKYVVYDSTSQSVSTSRYIYAFDRENYLVLKDLQAINPETNQPKTIIQSSTFYLHADIKYFFSLELNHRSINSRLEAFKSGPIRTIVRVDFFYSILKLNFDVGMFTEVKFYSNSLELPAIFYSPMGGNQLNEGSLFYYGFQFVDNPKAYRLATNLEQWQDRSESFWGHRRSASVYWLGLYKKEHMVYLEINPSRSLIDSGVRPYLYLKAVPAVGFNGISNNEVHELAKAPVNAGVVFDLTKFAEGENEMGFRLFFENNSTAAQEKMYKSYHNWGYKMSAIVSGH